MSKYAAIDIGTNAVRLLIGELDEANEQKFVKKISYTRIPIRLGIDVFENGRISDKKIDDFVKSIQAFKLISEVFNVKKLRACATSAMREADNAKEVIKKVKKETQVQIEIIDGSEEAELILSTFFLLEFDGTIPFVVIDVGGGSTEISIFRKGEKVTARSFPTGTVRLLKGKVKSIVWNELDDWIKSNFRSDTEYLTFATGGNINKIHKILGKKSTESITMKEFKNLYKDMKDLTDKQRERDYKLKSDRSDVIIPAFEIYLKIFKGLNPNEFFVPKIGLSDGIIYNLHQKNIVPEVE